MKLIEIPRTLCYIALEMKQIILNGILLVQVTFMYALHSVLTGFVGKISYKKKPNYSTAVVSATE